MAAKRMWYVRITKNDASHMTWHHYRDMADRFYNAMRKDGWAVELGRECEPAIKTAKAS